MRLHDLTLSTFTTLTLLLASFGLCGCDLGDKSIGGDADTGDGDGDPGDGDGGSGDGDGDTVGACGQETETVLTDPDAVPTSYAQTLAAYLAQIEGDYAGSLSWNPDDGPIQTAYAETSSPLTVSVSYTGGDIVLTEVELLGEFPNGQLGGFPCSNTLAIPVTLSFASDDGVFAESFEIDVVATSDGFEIGQPSYYFALDFEALAGSLTLADFTFEGGTVTDVILTGELSGPALVGAVNMEAEVLGGIGFGPVAGYSADRL